MDLLDAYGAQEEEKEEQGQLGQLGQQQQQQRSNHVKSTSAPPVSRQASLEVQERIAAAARPGPGSLALLGGSQQGQRAAAAAASSSNDSSILTDGPLFSHMSNAQLAARGAVSLAVSGEHFDRTFYAGGTTKASGSASASSRSMVSSALSSSSSSGVDASAVAALDELQRERARRKQANALKSMRKRTAAEMMQEEDDVDDKKEDGGDDSESRTARRSPWAAYDFGTGSVPATADSASADGDATAAAAAAAGQSEPSDDSYAGEDRPRKRGKHDDSDTRVGLVGGVIRTRSTFHGERLYDYQGRSYARPPVNLTPNNDHECFVPKKKLYSFSGHTDAVASIDIFPRFGHMVLSGSMDMTVKLWSLIGKRGLLRTFYGHSRAVKGVTFHPHDDRRCLSYAYDRLINMWDTETGACVGSYTAPGGDHAVANAVKFHPQREQENVFIAACSDKRLYQFDTRTGGVVQTYDEHMGPVNAIAWLEHGKKFVSSSDDKSLRIWEFGFPNVIKTISEPDMHSMPALAHHPREPMFTAQSLDNTILVFNSKTREKHRQVRKMKFRGHNTAGYACQMTFSPNGHYLVSGTAGGSMVFWDWENQRKVREIDAHQKGTVCIDVKWHPLEPSQVVSCGWDGKIHLWG